MRQTLIGGSRKMIVYDDLEPSEKIKVYDKGITLTDDPGRAIYQMLVGYRTGDMWAPQLEIARRSPSSSAHFVDCIENGQRARHRRPRRPARRRILEAATQSMPSAAGSSNSQGCDRVIPFLDLKAQYRQIKPEIDAAVSRGPRKRAVRAGAGGRGLRRAFCGLLQGAATASRSTAGTRALHLALLAAGVGPGDEVITVSMTFVATTAAILYSGAKPVFVDVDPRHLDDGSGLIEAAITPRTKAILPVHLHGLMADMDPIMEIARRHGLVVIEDAAQAHGAEYKGRRAGLDRRSRLLQLLSRQEPRRLRRGRRGRHQRPELAQTIALLRDWGQEAKYNHVVTGYNYRMDGIQGAVLNVKMDYIEAWTEARGRSPRSTIACWQELAVGRPRRRRTAGTSTMSTRSGSPSATRCRGAAGSGHRRRHSLSRSGPSSEGLRGPRLPSGRLPGHRRLRPNEFLSLPIYPELQPEQVAKSSSWQASRSIRQVGPLPKRGIRQ